MKHKIWLGLAACMLIGASALAADDAADADWANLKAYRAANATLPAIDEKRVVFMGDSITEFWDKAGKQLFADKSYVNRGISGQTTPQMLVRFRPDVIDLKPRVVVILAGTNDIAGNTGPASNEMIEANIASMAELATLHGISVVLCAVLPADHYYWIPEVKPAERIVALNKWIKDYAARSGYGYVDYFTPMVNDHLGLKREYSEDGVHPNEAGYRVMEALVRKALAKFPPGK
jgi:lysophospholipase L1-like esterase